MTRLKKYGFNLLFFSLPMVALFKGKGIVLSLALLFFLVGGAQKAYTHVRNIKLNLGFLMPLALLVLVLLGNISDLAKLYGATRLLLLLFCGYYTIMAIAQSPYKSFIHKTFVHGIVLYITFLLLECYTGFASFLYTGTKHFNTGLFLRGTVILTFLSIPFWHALKVTKHPKLYSFLLLLSVGLILLKAQPSAARAAVLVAGLSVLMAQTTYGLKVLFCGLSLWLVTAPFIFIKFLTRNALFSVMHYLPSSYQHRIQIWEIFAKKSLMHPWMGHGFRARMQTLAPIDKICLHYKTGVNPPQIPQISHDLYPWGKAICFDEAVITTHPHNAALQIWFEGGLFGVITALCFLWGLYRVLMRQPEQQKSMFVAVGSLAVVYWNISFGLWQNWMIALIALTIALIHTIKGPLKKGITHV